MSQPIMPQPIAIIDVEPIINRPNQNHNRRLQMPAILPFAQQRFACCLRGLSQGYAKIHDAYHITLKERVAKTLDEAPLSKSIPGALCLIVPAVANHHKIIASPTAVCLIVLPTAAFAMYAVIKQRNIPRPLNDVQPLISSLYHHPAQPVMVATAQNRALNHMIGQNGIHAFRLQTSFESLNKCSNTDVIAFCMGGVGMLGLAILLIYGNDHLGTEGLGYLSLLLISYGLAQAGHQYKASQQTQHSYNKSYWNQ